MAAWKREVPKELLKLRIMEHLTIIVNIETGNYQKIKALQTTIKVVKTANGELIWQKYGRHVKIAEPN